MGPALFTWRTGLVGGLLLCLSGAVPGNLGTANEAPVTGVRSVMHEIFRALTVLLPLSLNEEQFRAPTQRQRILEALSTLMQNTEMLKEHGQHLGPSYEYLRRSLLMDAQEVGQHYAANEFEEARFTLQQLTENCFACHTRLPSSSHFDLGKRFIEQTNLDDLFVEERVRLAVATRQFDMALDMYETLFRSSETSVGDIDLMGGLEEYMKIVLRVQNDFTRAIATVTALQRRADVPYYLRTLIRNWIEALHELQGHQTQGDLLQEASKLIREARVRNRFPADRMGFVHFVAGSSLLHRIVNDTSMPQAAMVEAYYLLGVAESYISRSLWLSETEFFLETAIRLAPSSPYARQAYAFLEEYILTGYSGSSGLHVPPEVQSHLAALRRLINEPARARENTRDNIGSQETPR